MALTVNFPPSLTKLERSLEKHGRSDSEYIETKNMRNFGSIRKIRGKTASTEGVSLILHAENILIELDRDLGVLDTDHGVVLIDIEKVCVCCMSIYFPGTEFPVGNAFNSDTFTKQWKWMGINIRTHRS